MFFVLPVTPALNGVLCYLFITFTVRSHSYVPYIGNKVTVYYIFPITFCVITTTLLCHALLQTTQLQQ